MPMSAPLLVKRVTFTVTKERKLHGILTVTGSQIQWSPHDPTESQPHHVDIKDVTGTKTDRSTAWRIEWLSYGILACSS